MNRRYPPDADFDDCFQCSSEDFEKVLAAFDANDTDRFDELVEEFVSDEDDLPDMMSWWGRAAR